MHFLENIQDCHVLEVGDAESAVAVAANHRAFDPAFEVQFIYLFMKSIDRSFPREFLYDDE